MTSKMTKDEVFKIAKEVFEEVCELNEIKINEPITMKTPIASFSGRGYFDSLALVNFITGVEQRLLEKGIEITIASENAFSKRLSPFLNMRLFVNFIVELINEADK